MTERLRSLYEYLAPILYLYLILLIIGMIFLGLIGIDTLKVFEDGSWIIGGCYPIFGCAQDEPTQINPLVNPRPFEAPPVDPRYAPLNT